MPAVAGSKGTAEPGKAERKEDGRRRRPAGASSAGRDGRSASPRCSPAGGACPPAGTRSRRGQGGGAPRDANSRLHRQVRAVHKTTRGWKKRENEKIHIFLKITKTHTHREKLPQQNKPPVQTKSSKQQHNPNLQRPNLIYLSWPGRLLWFSLLAGWGLLGDPRLVRSLCPLEWHKARVPRGGPHAHAARGWGSAGPGPPAPTI